MSRCVPIVMKEGKSNKQAVGQCEGIFSQSEKTSKKESMFCKVHGYETKQSDSGDFVKGGFISTTHLDSGWFDEERGKLVKDRVHEDTLVAWEQDIASDIPRANKVSVYHEREPVVAGKGLKETVQVVELSDGHKGLYVDTKLDQTRNDFYITKSRIDNGFIDAYSIEYDTGLKTLGRYYDGAVEEIDHGDWIERILMPATKLNGWTMLGQPMNENAIMIKQAYNSSLETKETSLQAVKEDIIQENIKQNKEVNTMTETEIKTVPTMTDAELKEYKELKEAKAKSEQAIELKKAFTEMLKDKKLVKEIFESKGEDKPLVNDEKVEEDKPEEKIVEDEATKELKSSMEYMEYKQVLEGKKEIDIAEKFRRAGAFAEKKGFIWAEGKDSIGYQKSKRYEPRQGVSPKSEFKTFGVNGNRMEFKSLGITTNQNTDTDYLLSAAELRDVFDPIMYDVLNQSTKTWGIIRKEDFSNKGNNQVQFKFKTGTNSTSGFYTGNSISLGNTKRLNLMTKFKKIAVGISVDGDMVAAAQGGPISDVFGQEVMDSTETMLSDVNSQLFAETGLETAAEPIGFEFITDSAGNTTMYNMTRDGDKTSATYNGLSPDTATDTYINQASARISLDNLRKAIQQAELEGASKANLVFVTNPIQERLFKGIYDAALGFVAPASLRAGFEGMAQFDAVPIFTDKDCNSDDWFLIDLETHKAAIWVPPTLEMLGKRSDAEEGFVKMYYAIYNTNPRRMVQIYGCATS